MSAASVHPGSAADCLIRSAIDISHPRQQGNPPASSSAASGPVLSMASVQVQLGVVAILRWFLACLQASFTVLLTLLLLLRRRAVVITCLRKVKHRITAPLRAPRLAVPPEETNVRANAAVVHEHANVRASAVMTDDNDVNVHDGNFDDTLGEILGASFRFTTSLNFDLALGAGNQRRLA